MAFDYAAVPWDPQATDPQPQLRAELEAEGFRLVGGCALAAAESSSVARMADTYGPEHAADFARWAARPSQVFVAPDRTAYAQLDWMWDCRYAVLTTVLADGTIVQTLHAWGADPVWPKRLAARYGATDRLTEQLAMATDPGARVVEGGIAATWAAHRRRVSEMGAPVADHSSVADFVAVYEAESRARSVWSRRVQVAAGVLAFLLVLVPFLAVSVALGEQPWWVDVAVLLAAGLAFRETFLRLWMRARRWRRLRPAFRAPVPVVG